MKRPETFWGYIHCRIRGHVSYGSFCGADHVSLLHFCMVKVAVMQQSDICYLPNNSLHL